MFCRDNVKNSTIIQTVSNSDCDTYNIMYDRTGKYDCILATSPVTSINNDNEERIDETHEGNNHINVSIFRYKFVDEFTSELYKFSKIHQYDHRKDFKEAWKIWTEDNSEIVDEEVNRLTLLGYEGDILDKMFKSARYYFRKKSVGKKEPQKRRVYVGVNKTLLESIDEHIKQNINNIHYKPSDGFNHFCEENIHVLKEEINSLIKSGLTDSTEIKNKIKKTYKNRYFLLINK